MKPKNRFPGFLCAWLLWPLEFVASADAVAAEPVEAVDFTAQVVYRSERPPGYAAWASFFPGDRGTWYIGCEEVSRPDNPLPQTSPQQWYGMGLPAGYDKSQHLMEAVLLESVDGLKSWKVVSREPYRHQHSVHQFASAHTIDGRFLRFNWACYALDPAVKTNEILRVSDDGGRTWTKAAPFCSDRFAYFPHRLRTLGDGTLVLCMPMAPRWGKGADRPIRSGMRLDTNNEMRMTLHASFDSGRTWQGPLPILDGLNVSETDFVELADGHLLVLNNSIFSKPGRQFIYRDEALYQRTLGIRSPGNGAGDGVPDQRWPSGGDVCARAPYYWSDDLGQTWNPLAGIPDRGPEVYQPWIQALPDGRIACAGHYGYDDPISTGRRHENYINLHLFRLKVNRRTKDTNIEIERDYDETGRRWLNSFTLRLTEGGQPMPEREMELWFVERDQPGYDSYNATPLAERMRAGGTILKAKTDAEGRARFTMPERFDAIDDPHASYQLVARFNADGVDARHKPLQTPQLEVYALAPMPATLEPAKAAK